VSDVDDEDEEETILLIRASNVLGVSGRSSEGEGGVVMQEEDSTQEAEVSREGGSFATSLNIVIEEVDTNCSLVVVEGVGDVYGEKGRSSASS
jgi:hypothetical protein